MLAIGHIWNINSNDTWLYMQGFVVFGNLEHNSIDADLYL